MTEIFTQYELDDLTPSGSIPSSQLVESETTQNSPQTADTVLSKRVEAVENDIKTIRSEFLKKKDDIVFNKVDILGRLTAYWGKIGGWLVGNGVISAKGINLNSNDGSLFSDNYVEGVSGWKIYGDGSAEFQTLLASEFVKVFAQDAEPTTGMTEGDFWYDTNDSNKRYIYRSSAWVVDTSISNWSEVVDDDGHKPEDDATDGADAGTNLRDSTLAVLEDSEIKNIDSYELGENINAGQVACFKQIATTDNVTIVKDTYVHGGATADTNYGNATDLYIGNYDSGTAYALMTLPTSGAPAVAKIMKVELMLYLEGASFSGTKTITLMTCDADWTEGDGSSGVTYNTRPAVTDNFATYYTVKTKDFTTSDIASYLVFDITHIYKQWLNADINNYGFQIEMDASAGQYAWFVSSDDSSNKPLLRFTTYDQSDGKAYLASANDYNLCRTMIGIAIESGTTGQTKKFQKFGRINVSNSDIGKRMYLSTGGNLVSNNISSSITRMIMISKDTTPSSTDTELKIQESNFFIESITVPSGGTTTNLKFYCHGDARKAVVVVGATASSGGGAFYGALIAEKEKSVSIYFPTSASVGAGWDSDCKYVSVAGSGLSALKVYSVDFYN